MIAKRSNSDRVHLVDIGADRDHRLGSRAVLHVHEDDVRPCGLHALDAGIERCAELIYLDPANGIHGTRLPYY